MATMTVTLAWPEQMGVPPPNVAPLSVSDAGQASDDGTPTGGLFTAPEPAQASRRRGRPPGSRNRPKQ